MTRRTNLTVVTGANPLPRIIVIEGFTVLYVFINSGLKLQQIPSNLYSVTITDTSTEGTASATTDNSTIRSTDNATIRTTDNATVRTNSNIREILTIFFI